MTFGTEVELSSHAAYFNCMNLTVDPAEDDYIRQLWVAEVRRRLDDVRSGRIKTLPAYEFFARKKCAVAK
jgi:hypothetical protein